MTVARVAVSGCVRLVSAWSAGRRRAGRGIHGRKRTASAPVARSVQPLAFHGRARTTSCGRLEDAADLLVEEVLVAVDAVAVNGEQDRDAVSGPGGDLGGVPSGVQPQ
jgi:hypothetical protein